MAAIQIEIPAKANPVTLNQAKSHLRVSIPDDDDLINLYVGAATEDVEAFLMRSLVTKGYRQSLDSFPYFTDTAMSQLAYPPSYYSLPRYSTTLWNYSQMIKLFYTPLVAVDRISYCSSDSGWQDLLPAPLPWAPGIAYALGDQRQDSNGNLQEVTAVANDGTSGATPPTWGATVGSETPDHALVWTCRQVPAPAGDFIYDAESEPPRIFPMPGQNWPSVLYTPNAVQIHYRAGYGDDDENVPRLAKLGVLLTTAALYENRDPICAGTSNQLPPPIQNLLWGLRVLDYAPTRG